MGGEEGRPLQLLQLLAQEEAVAGVSFPPGPLRWGPRRGRQGGQPGVAPRRLPGHWCPLALLAGQGLLLLQQHQWLPAGLVALAVPPRSASLRGSAAPSSASS